MLNYTLGTIEASEALIKDLYIDLRAKVNAWSKITQQTPQARMGYVGQHLVSVVTGYPGGKSGARGYDLVIDDERHGEIKTCYRVDQLGSCNACGAVVSSFVLRNNLILFAFALKRILQKVWDLYIKIKYFRSH